MSIKLALTTLSFSIICSFSCSFSLAATVKTVKGQRVLIDLEGADTMMGDEYFLINPTSSKKSAIIRIRQVKSGKAIADVTKGQAAVGYTLQAKGSSRMSAEPTYSNQDPSAAPTITPVAASSNYSNLLKDSWGLLGSYLMNTMDATIKFNTAFTTETTTAAMTGTGFGVGGYYDYVLTNEIVAHVSAMYEQFIAQGPGSSASTQAPCTSDCNAKINYLSLYGVGKYYFSKDKYRYWAGGGMGYLQALSKSSTALNESKISANQVVVVGGGADIQLDRRNYVPLSLEYNYFLASENVTANQILLRAGYGWNF